ncbi:MAG: C25 family cysteine peptidase [bacterium]
MSPRISLVKNSLEEVVLQWDQEGEETLPHRILLFVPGPVADATYSITRFTWRARKAEEGLQEGDERSFPEDPPFGRRPMLILRELGLLGGARLAVLTLQFPTGYYDHDTYSPIRDAGASPVAFPRGEMVIRFASLDPSPFAGFPPDIQEVVSNLALNFPPLRSVDTPPAYPPFPAYFDSPSLKVRCGEEGLVSVRGSEVLARFPEVFPVESLALFRERKPVSSLVFDKGGRLKPSGALSPDDTIRFFVPRSTSPYSPETVTWITRHAESHREIPRLAAGAPGEATSVLERRIHLEEDHAFIEDNDKNEEQSLYWMWHDFVQNGTQELVIPLPEGILDATARLYLRMAASQSYIYLATDAVKAEWNGMPLTGDLYRTNAGIYSATMAVALGPMREGTNTLRLNVHIPNLQNNEDAAFYLDWAELRIRQTVTPSREPYFNPEGNPAVLIPPNTDSVWMVRDPGAVAGTLVKDGSQARTGDIYYAEPEAGAVAFPPDPAAWKVYFLPAGAAVANVTLEPVIEPLKQRTILTDTRPADVIFISPGAWRPSLRPYADYLAQRGYACRLVAVEELYDLFGDGRLSPHCLRDFLRYVYWHWDRPRPSHVQLVGDATWDYWGRYRNHVRNYVPGFRENKNYAVENWFVRCDEDPDPLPDMMVARWAVRAATEIDTLVSKSLAYARPANPGPWMNHVFQLTDDDFERFSDELARDWIPAGFRLTRRVISDYPLIDNIYLPERLRISLRSKTSPEATADIVSILNQGVFLWDYFGHGAPNVMGEERMFFGGGSKYSDARKLTNGDKLPVLWAFTCETAMFDYPRDKWNISLGEDMLAHPGGGMIALVGATGRGFPSDHIVLARAMHEATFARRFKSLGQIFYAAQLLGVAQYPRFEPIEQFTILGDPFIEFPEFVEIQGEGQPAGRGIAYDWILPDTGNAPNGFRIWLEDGRSVVADEAVTSAQAPGGRIVGEMPYTGEHNPGIRKVGLDAVAVRDGRVRITHGAVILPPEKPAAPLIVPTTGCLPDLDFVPGSLTVKPPSPRAGQTIFLEARVHNQGLASATDITIRGYSGTGETGKKELEVSVGRRGAVVDRLDPGQEIPVRVRWDPIGNAGPQMLTLVIDPDRRIPREDPRERSLSTTITVSKKADLVVDASRFEIQPIEDGRRCQIYFEIHNQGESRAEKIIVELALKQPGRSELETIRIPKLYDLDPGQRQSFGGIRVPAGFAYLEIIADPDEIVDEETHANNRYRYTPPEAGN